MQPPAPPPQPPPPPQVPQAVASAWAAALSAAAVGELLLFAESPFAPGAAVCAAQAALRDADSDSQVDEADWRSHEQAVATASVNECLVQSAGTPVLNLQWVDMSAGGRPLDALCHGLRMRRPPLKRVIIGACMLGDAGAIAVVRELAFVDLPVESIDLYFNQITNKGMHGIVEIISHWALAHATAAHDMALECLNFGWNDIGDDACRDLAELLRYARTPTSFFHLRTLGLAHCLITDSGATELYEEMKRSDSLREIRLEGNDKVTAAVMDSVQSTTAARTMGHPAPRHTVGFYGRRVETRRDPGALDD